MLELRTHSLQIDARFSNIVRGEGVESQFFFFCERPISMLKHIKDGLTFEKSANIFSCIVILNFTRARNKVNKD